MKRCLSMFGLLVWAVTTLAQTPATTPVTTAPKKDPTLAERYYQMKVAAETYQDYKVIKEFALDGLWKVVTDSLHAKNKSVQDAHAEVARLNNELTQSKNALKQKEDSMQEIVFSSDHINFIGINFSKTMFIILTCVVVAVLVAMVLGLLAQMKIVTSNASGSKNAVDEISREFEDYKKKAMEKQSKLSRELQTERNKLQELKGTR